MTSAATIPSNESSTLAEVQPASSFSHRTVWDVLTRHESVAWSMRPSLATTRHRTEFDVMAHVGRGGFGVVTQVRHKLDGWVYALKQVPLSRDKHLPITSLEATDDGDDAEASTSHDASVLLREVQILSRIQHPNVVRYYGAWMEQGDHVVDDECSVSFDSSGTIDTADVQTVQNHTIPCHICQNYYTDWEVSFEQWGLIDAVLQPLNLCQVCYRQSLPPDYQEHGSNVIPIRHKVPPQQYLFILMEYCGHGTLASFNESWPWWHRPAEHDHRAWSYFVQCVQGVAACHAAGCVHRDIKPHNILMAHDSIKIGDLGLATMRSSTSSNEQPMDPPGPTVTNDQTSHVGTYLYSAPEVATGVYSAACDVFSLGVVLVELYCHFDTNMERAMVLGRLHQSPIVLPDDLEQHHATIATLARRLLQHDPRLRPTCAALLHEWDTSDDTMALARIPTTLEPTVSELLALVAQLQQTVRDQNATIQGLQRVLDQHCISA